MNKLSNSTDCIVCFWLFCVLLMNIIPPLWPVILWKLNIRKERLLSSVKNSIFTCSAHQCVVRVNEWFGTPYLIKVFVFCCKFKQSHWTREESRSRSIHRSPAAEIIITEKWSVNLNTKGEKWMLPSRITRHIRVQDEPVRRQNVQSHFPFHCVVWCKWRTVRRPNKFQSPIWRK